MWHIRSIMGPGSDGATIVGGLPGSMAQRRIGERLGPQGARYMVIASGSILFMEDIGQIGAPGGGRDWGLRVNGTLAGYFAGEGAIDIQLDASKNATITGVTPSLTTVMSTPAQVDFLVQSPNQSCGFVIKTLSGPSAFSFSTGNNAVDITALVHSPRQGLAVDTVGFAIQRSDGLTINAATASSDHLILNAIDGHLVFMRKKMVGAFTWAVTITNPYAVPCYIVVIVGSDSPIQDGQFYSQLPAETRAQILSVGVFPPPAEGMQLQSLWDDFNCTVCQARYYTIIGVFALLAPELFAIMTYRRLLGWVATAETINQVATILKSVLQVETGVASRIANGIIAASDPLEWPRIICELSSEC